jgi:hypothetical protein
VEPDLLPCVSRHLLRLPPHLKSLPSKRRKVIKRGTHTSTYQTCDHISMSTESGHKVIGIPLTHIPTMVNGSPMMPSTTMVLVLEVPVITPIQPMVSTQPIVTNSFGSIFGTPRYNTQSILMASSPFSYGMSNITSQFLSSIPTMNKNPSIGLRGMALPHISLSFGGDHIPQTNPMVGSQPPFHLRSNPSLNSPRWSNQPGRQDIAYVPSFTPTSSTPIPNNTFCMMNPPLSSIFPPRGG